MKNQDVSIELLFDAIRTGKMKPLTDLEKVSDNRFVKSFTKEDSGGRAKITLVFKLSDVRVDIKGTPNLEAMR